MSAGTEQNAELVKQICEAHGLRIATAESVTVGRLQSMLGSVSGSSTFFVGGVTAYDLERKVQILGIDRAHAEPVDCVSPRVAAEMAKGAARLFDADIAVATTGYAEPPDGAGTSKPYAFFAIWNATEGSNECVQSGRIDGLGRDRTATQQLFADRVLQELTTYLAARHGIVASNAHVMRIERREDGRYRLGSTIVKDLGEVNGAVRATKRPILITALQIAQPFEVVTTEGLMAGRPGDWLIAGVVGEVYICPDDVFRRSYDVVPLD
jgi:nicotinamide-nucleotide amidase